MIFLYKLTPLNHIFYLEGCPLSKKWSTLSQTLCLSVQRAAAAAVRRCAIRYIRGLLHLQASSERDETSMLCVERPCCVTYINMHMSK